MELIGLNNLCKPALAYFIISAIAFVVMGLQNLGSRDVYCLGTYRCDRSDTAFIFILKAVYIVFWTWILNLMCSKGYSTVAWLFVIIPFVIFGITLAMYFNR
jgi:hypothetical protein